MSDKFTMELEHIEIVEEDDDEKKHHITLTVKKGGAGSGHHGHAGLAGTHGGSLPGKGSGNGKSKPKTAKKVSHLDFNYKSDEAEIWGQTWYTNNLPTDEQREVITAYSGAMYQDINGYLRHGYEVGRVTEYEIEDTLDASLASDFGYTPENITEKLTDALDEIMENNSTPDAITVYRSTDTKFKEDYPVGSMFVDKGFSSTSLTHTAAHSAETIVDPDKRSVMKILVPKGYPAVYAGVDSWVEWEKEVILDRGTAFRVIGYEIDGMREDMIVEVITND